MHAKGLPQAYWAEAFHTSAYVANRSPTTTVTNITPEEAWTGKKLTISHLRTFGCTAYMHIPDQQRTKLDKHSLKCIFVGYAIHSKAYKLYDPVGRKMHLSRDVIFVEDDQKELDVASIQPPIDKGKRIVEDFPPSQSSTPCTSSAPIVPSTSSSSAPLEPSTSSSVDQSLRPEEIEVHATSF